MPEEKNIDRKGGASLHYVQMNKTRQPGWNISNW
jgi:hypothetical protein